MRAYSAAVGLSDVVCYGALQAFILDDSFWDELKAYDTLLYPVFKALQALQSNLCLAGDWSQHAHDMISALRDIPAESLPRSYTPETVKLIVDRRVSWMLDPAFVVASVLLPRGTGHASVSVLRKKAVEFARHHYGFGLLPENPTSPEDINAAREAMTKIDAFASAISSWNSAKAVVPC